MTKDQILTQIQAMDEATRSNLILKTTVTDTVNHILGGIETDDTKLKVNRIWAEDKDDNNDVRAQALTRNRHQSWSDDVRADVSLIDKATGKEIDRVKSLKVSSLPKLTPRNTYLIKGNEYQFTKQSRLKPGVYTRVQDNGEISSFFNVDKTIDFERGFNNNFKINFEPERKAFVMTYGTKNIPLINVLHALGVSKDEVKKRWGSEVYEANEKLYGKKDATNQRKMFEAVFGKEPDSGQTQEQVSNAIRERLFATELDPDTTNITLGKPYHKVDEDALLTASRKIIDIHKGDVEGDERDALVFKSFYDADDHIREKLVKNADKIVNSIKFRLKKTRSINKSISSQIFDPYTLGTITNSQLSNPPSQTNLLSILGEGSKITIMGEGGIGSTNQVSGESRNISNSEVGFIDPLHTPEGGSIGIAAHHTLGTVKLGNDLYGQFVTPGGEKHFLKPADVHGKVIAFADEYDAKGKPKQDLVRVVKHGKVTTAPAHEVDYIVKNPVNMFDVSVNLIPFLDSIQGNRGLTAAKMKEQALPLKHRDKPLFKIVDKHGTNISAVAAAQIAMPTSPVDGTVDAIGKDEMVIKDAKGDKHKVQLYDNFPLNSESFIHNHVVVKVGDAVKKGQRLADNNNTKDGEFALGANLRVAYVPWKGYNYEDSTIISESAAKKLTSEHLYNHSTKRSSAGIFSKAKFKAYYPEDIKSANAAKLDEDGVIKVGETVDHGDVMIAHLEKRAPTADDLALGRLDKQLKKDFSNMAIKWEKSHKGVVTGVEKHGNTVTVNVKTEEPLSVADKLSGLHGNKHIVAKIVPDHEMPVTEDGKVIDMTMSPIGVSNRINTSQLLEAAAGKIAEKTGQQYVIENFKDQDNAKTIVDDMKKAGVEEKEYLTDPVTGKKTKNKVFTGVAHILKLEHKVDHKFSARYREGHDSNQQPVSGGETGGKNVGRMETGALLARGANENLKEMFNVKGQRNDEFWKALETGQTLPPPVKPFVWDKMMAMMKGAGINVEQNGKMYALKPMTDADILKLSAGEITDPTLTYRKKDLAPMRGGLFDPIKTGGMQGDHYTHFKLPEKILNPMMETAAASLLDMSNTEIEAVINGDKFVDSHTGQVVDKNSTGAVSGGAAIASMLARVDTDKVYEEAQHQAEKARTSTDINKANRKLRYIKQLRKNKMKPSDYMIEHVLITPPKYRPMFTMGADSTVIMSDINDLYQQTGMSAEAMRDMKKALHTTSGGSKDLENVMMAQPRAALYQDVKALMGLREPTAYLHRIKDKKGFVTQIDGGKRQTKEGFYQDKVVSRRQDLVGRSTIILNPGLGGDEVGIPKEMATKLFQPFIMKKMVSLGYTPLEAQKHIKDNTPTFQKARELVSNERLVILNRAPSLHRWNMTAFKPVLVDGRALHMPAVVVSKMFGGDFDGDAMQVHVPVSAKAVNEAAKMMPSADIIKTGHGISLAAPDLDITTGAWLVSKGKGGKDAGKFASLEEARAAHKNHKLEYSDTVDIGGVKAPYGMHEINSVLPEDVRDYKKEITNKNFNAWMVDVSNKHNDKISLALADKIKDVANEYNSVYGLTLGVSDTMAPVALRNRHLQPLQRMRNASTKDFADASVKAQKAMHDDMKELYHEDTMVGIPLHSGGGKGIGNMGQIAGSPVIVQDFKGRPVRVPILHSYSEGMNTGEYWAAAQGARYGNVQKSILTYKPGWITSDLINSVYTTRIANSDETDDKGLESDAGNAKHVLHRYLAQDVKDSGGKIVAKRGELIGSDAMNKFKKHGIKRVHVQSPLTDPTPGDGISSYSYGADAKGKLHEPGVNIGIISAHTITEPAVNMALKAVHSGGTLISKGGDLNALDRTLRLTQEPPQRATMSSVNGKIKSIKKSAVGGHDVVVEDGKGEEHEHYVDTGRNMLVGVGDKVEMGDRLSEGNLSAHDVLKYKGMPAAQQFLVNELDEINDGRIDRRDMETLVRGITNTTRIKKATGVPWVAGDVAPLTTIEHHNRHRVMEVDVEDGQGAKLNRYYGKWSPGTHITPEIVRGLQDHGIKRIEVEHPPIVHEPFLSAGGIGSKASNQEDWIARLSHNRLEAVMREGASRGWVSDVSGSEHPLPQLVTGQN